MDKKKITIILIIAILILIIGTTIFFTSKKEKEEENKGPTGPETLVAEIADLEVSNVLFGNIRIVNQDDYTVVSMNIANNNDYNINLGDFIVKIYQDNNLLDTLNPHVDKNINKNSSKEIKVSIKQLYYNVDKVEIELPNLEIIEETNS